MNTHRQFSIPRLIILIAGLAIVSMDVAAGPLKVNSADPNSGTQGQEPFEVVIKGIGFTNANKVRFLVSKSSNDTGRVAVDLLRVDNDETITAKVAIPLDATVADYDIEVQLSNGRKGKGTTLFSVKSGDGSGNGGGDPGPGEINVQVAIDDFTGDTLWSDEAGAYIDGIDRITANISVNTGFRITPEVKSTRTITTDFGPTVDCASGAPDNDGQCIIDALGDVIECPHAVAARLTLGQCAGARMVSLFFRDVFIDADTTTNILTMPPDGNQFLGQHYDVEIRLSSEKRQSNGWALIFKPSPGLQACQRDVAENLGVTAFDFDVDGTTDLWTITTDTPLFGGGATKIACLAKVGKTSLTFVGFVEMQFGFDIVRVQ